MRRAGSTTLGHDTTRAPTGGRWGWTRCWEGSRIRRRSIGTPTYWQIRFAISTSMAVCAARFKWTGFLRGRGERKLAYTLALSHARFFGFRWEGQLSVALESIRRRSVRQVGQTGIVILFLPPAETSSEFLQSTRGLD